MKPDRTSINLTSTWLRFKISTKAMMVSSLIVEKNDVFSSFWILAMTFEKSLKLSWITGQRFRVIILLA